MLQWTHLNPLSRVRQPFRALRIGQCLRDQPRKHRGGFRRVPRIRNNPQIGAVGRIERCCALSVVCARNLGVIHQKLCDP